MRHAMAIVGLFLLSVLGLWGLSDLRTPPRPAATGQRSLRQIVRKPTRTGRLNCGAQSGYCNHSTMARNVAPAQVVHVALLAIHRRCGELPWLGLAATAEACLARVLEQPATSCSRTHFTYADHGDRNCACATPGSHCDPSDDRATRTAVASLYRISAPEWTPRTYRPRGAAARVYRPRGAAARVEVRPVWPDGPPLVAGGYHLRCGREPWLGIKATAAACAAAVLAQPWQNCSHTFFVWGNVGDGACACAPPQSRCVDGDGLVYAAAASLYYTSAKVAKDTPVVPRRDGFRGAEALPFYQSPFSVVLICCGEAYVRACVQKLTSELAAIDTVLLHDAATAHVVPEDTVHTRWVQLGATGSRTPSIRYACADAKLSLYRYTGSRIAIAMDLDTTVLAPVNELAGWVASAVHPPAWLAVANESIDSFSKNWYRSRWNHHKHFVGRNGLNTGVMIVNTALMPRNLPAWVIPSNNRLAEQDALQVRLSCYIVSDTG